MKILLQYLKPYKWLVVLVLTLAAINIGFSLVDPIIFGKLVDLASYHQTKQHFSWDDFLYTKTDVIITNKDGKPIKQAVIKISNPEETFSVSAKEKISSVILDPNISLLFEGRISLK